MDRRALSALRGTHGYPNFVAAATFSRLADEMFSVGVVLLVLQRTRSPALAGITVAAATFPAVLSGPLIGAWLDRSGRRSLLYKIDRLLLIACLLGILAAAGHTPAFVVPLLGFITGTTLPATFGGLTSLIPLMVEDDLLPPANALEAASFNTAQIIGPALAGTIAAIGGPADAIVAEIALTFVALLLLLRIPGLDRGGTGGSEPIVSLVKAGLRFGIREPVIRAVTLTGVVSMVGMGFLTVAFPLWASADLGASRSASGYLWAAFSFGSLVGALGFARGQRYPQDAVAFGGIFVLGVVMLSWPLVGSLAIALVLVGIAALPDGPALAATFAVRQQRSPAELLTQVMTTLSSLKVGAFSLGAAVAGSLASSVSPRALIAVAAALQITGAGAGLAMRLRARPLARRSGA